MMKEFMVDTFSDLILRVSLSFLLSSTALGSTGIWLSWPIGWTIGTMLSIYFYFKCTKRIEKIYGRDKREEDV